jgi:methyl-accepting chemotaxis protein
MQNASALWPCGHSAHFQNPEAPHAKIHFMAKDVVNAFNSGDKQRAETAYHDMKNISGVMGTHLEKIKSECNLS